MSSHQAHSTLIDFGSQAGTGRRSITPDEISVGELKAAARLIMRDIRDTRRAVVITEETGRAIGILVCPQEYSRMRSASESAGRPLTRVGPDDLRNRLAQRFPARVRVYADPARALRSA